MYRNQKGVTITILAFTIVLLLIVSGTIIIKANDYLAAKKLLNLENDIKLLQEELPIYYEIHNSLPASGQINESQINKIRAQNQLNSNDSGNYLIVDLTLLPNLKLNNGYGKNNNQYDYYIVNTGSLSVYYLAGLNINGIMHYTIDQGNVNLSSTINKLNGSINISAISTSTKIIVNVESTYGINLTGYQFALNDGTWTNIVAENTYTFENLNSNQYYKINVKGIDNNGNVIIAENNGLKIKTKKSSNGSYNSAIKQNTPDTSKLHFPSTKYVTWEEQNNIITEVLSDDIPNNWYNYSSGKWANIKTTSIDSSLEAYWVWIPRFAYKLSESNTSTQIDVIFVKNNGKKGILDNGTEVDCYYTTDSEITFNRSGVYIDKSEYDEESETIYATDAWIIHPAFTFGNIQLNGIWVAKYEASSNVPSALNGGNNNTSLKVQIKPNVTSWRGITLSNIYTVCKNIQGPEGALGTNVSVNYANTSIDTHPATNMEWSAIAILSQSKYGIFNNDYSTTSSDGRIWNNPNADFITGNVGTTSADDYNQSTSNCVAYDSQYGSRASTTGNIYGVYDMAGGSWEYVMAVQNENDVPAHSSTGFITWPNSKYYTVYIAGSSDIDYNRGKIGDLTSELLRTITENPSRDNWNNDIAKFMYTAEPNLVRGGASSVDTGTDAGIFAFCSATGAAMDDCSFRPVLVCVNE